MGKTAEGAVWLDESKFSITNFRQFWRNTSEDDVIKFLKLFTEIKISEIKEIEPKYYPISKKKGFLIYHT